MRGVVGAEAQTGRGGGTPWQTRHRAAAEEEAQRHREAAATCPSLSACPERESVRAAESTSNAASRQLYASSAAHAQIQYIYLDRFPHTLSSFRLSRLPKGGMVIIEANHDPGRYNDSNRIHDVEQRDVDRAERSMQGLTSHSHDTDLGFV
jgi:hypothetical protein